MPPPRRLINSYRQKGRTFCLEEFLGHQRDVNGHFNVIPPRPDGIAHWKLHSNEKIGFLHRWIRGDGLLYLPCRPNTRGAL